MYVSISDSRLVEVNRISFMVLTVKKKEKSTRTSLSSNSVLITLDNPHNTQLTVSSVESSSSENC